MADTPFAHRIKALSLFYKLLGFLILCLVCSGLIAAWLITQQISRLVYTQARVVFKNDAHNINIFLQEHQRWLRTQAIELGQNDDLLIAVELDVVEEVQNIAKDYQTLLGIDEVVVTNVQGKVLSRGYDAQDDLDAEVLSRPVGSIEVGGEHQIFSTARLSADESDAIGHVVVAQKLTENGAFFKKLKEVIGKDAFLFLTKHDEEGMASVSEVGSTFAESPGVLRLSPVAPGLATAFEHQFIGTELALDDVFGHDDWSVVLLQSAAPLMRSIRQAQWGAAIFALAFIALIALVLGLFFAVHIRRPMNGIRQGITEITAGNLATHIALGRRDEWQLIEQALNQMTESLAQNEQLRAENMRLGAELEVTRQIQQMLLPTPQELREVEGLDIAGYMEPADEVGGDYYDVLQHNGQIKIGIGDVTGHGLESGVVMVMTQAVVRALLTIGETDPVRFLDALNQALFNNVQRMGTDKNLTLSLIDYADGVVKLSGQHEEMIVVRQGGAVELVDTVNLGFPIALDEDIADFVNQVTVQLAPGDGVVLYTDGITEAENMKGEQYSLKRLCEVVSQYWDQPSNAIKEVVVEDVRQHIGEQEVYDDITLVVVKQQ